MLRSWYITEANFFDFLIDFLSPIMEILAAVKLAGPRHAVPMAFSLANPSSLGGRRLGRCQATGLSVAFTSNSEAISASLRI